MLAERQPLEAADLASRFAQARRAALVVSLDGAALPAEETAAVRAVPIAARGDLFKRVFWNAWRLGKSAVGRHGAVDDLDRLRVLLEGAELACLEGAWQREDDELRLERMGCRSGAEVDRIFCDFCREAIDGLVSGLSDDLRFARRGSRGHGGERCEDLFFAAAGRDARLAPVPEPVAEHLARPLDRLAQLGVSFELVGLAENAVHVVAGDPRSAACGPSKLYFDLLAEHLAKRFPDLVLVDATPRAVMA